MPAVFISYRRSDSSDITGRIFDRLVGHFGSKPVKVVRDVDSIPIGEDFRDVLREKIKDCEVVLVVIGPNWTSLKDSKGIRRLDDAADTVRIEIEQALELKKKVIPVCVTHATMPGEDDLPDTLKKLAFRNGVQVRPDPDFNNDIKRLIEALDRIFKDKQIAEAKPPTLPPPQRHLHAPEPPPPPPVDARFASGPRGPQAASAAPAPRSPPAAATWHPASAGPSSTMMPPAVPSQPVVRPLPSHQPQASRGLLASTTGVMILLGGLVALCLCGGFSFFLYIGAVIVPAEDAADIKESIRYRQVVTEHLGEIESVEKAYGNAPRGPNGEYGYVFSVKGSKAAATVYGHTDYSSSPSKVVPDRLKLADGTEISLNGAELSK
ncbi:MAG: toll/interleukin-1 receptor domain-containing protein [Pirellulaceae bacterium]